MFTHFDLQQYIVAQLEIGFFLIPFGLQRLKQTLDFIERGHAAVVGVLFVIDRPTKTQNRRHINDGASMNNGRKLTAANGDDDPRLFTVPERLQI